MLRHGAQIFDQAQIFGRSRVEGVVEGEARISGCTYIDQQSIVRANARVAGCVDILGGVIDEGSIIYGSHIIET